MSGSIIYWCSSIFLLTIEFEKKALRRSGYSSPPYVLSACCWWTWYIWIIYGLISALQCPWSVGTVAVHGSFWEGSYNRLRLYSAPWEFLAVLWCLPVVNGRWLLRIVLQIPFEYDKDPLLYIIWKVCHLKTIDVGSISPKRLVVCVPLCVGSSLGDWCPDYSTALLERSEGSFVPHHREVFWI